VLVFSSKTAKPNGTMSPVEDKKKEIEAWDLAINSIKSQLHAIGPLDDTADNEDAAGNTLTIKWEGVRLSMHNRFTNSSVLTSPYFIV
jgi:hypothetical protein